MLSEISLFHKLTIINQIHMFFKGRNILKGCFSETQKKLLITINCSLPFIPLMSELAGHILSPSTRLAQHTADTDCQMNLDVTKADSMQGCGRGSISCQTMKREKGRNMVNGHTKKNKNCVTQQQCVNIYPSSFKAQTSRQIYIYYLYIHKWPHYMQLWAKSGGVTAAVP